MLSEILKQRDISVYKLAKDTNLPYTTVNELILGKKSLKDCSIKTIMPICNYLGISMDSLLNPDIKRSINTTWLDNKKKQYRFNTVIVTDLFDISRIHPLKQKQALEIYNNVCKDQRIKKVIIFGSSTNITCTIHSDIDIAIELNKKYINTNTKNEISQTIQELNNYDCDIIWLDRIEKKSNIYNNIKKGVTIYEQVI